MIDCVVMKNQATGKSRGFGFIKYRDMNCVDIVLEAGPHILDGREVRNSYERTRILRNSYERTRILCVQTFSQTPRNTSMPINVL